MNIKQGDVFWLMSDSGINHPHVVINVSKDDDSIFLCSITTNQSKASMPGVVILNAGEANLEKQSIVEVYKTTTVKQIDLKEYIGTLNSDRIKEILNGIEFVQRSFLDRLSNI